MLDSEVREKFKEFQKKSGKYEDLDIDEIRFEKINANKKNKYFTIHNGQRLKKSDLQQNKNTLIEPIEVYSASESNKEVFGYIERDKLKKISPNQRIYNGKTVLLNTGGSVGAIRFKSNFYNYTVIDNVIIYVANEDICYIDYLYFSLEATMKSDNFGYSNTLRGKDLEKANLIIPIPKDLTEKYTSFVIQEAIVEFLEYSFNIQEKIKQTIDKRYDVFTRLRKALIPSTFHRDYIKVRFAKYAKEKDIGFNITDVDFEIKKLNNISQITMGQSPKSESLNRNKEGLPFFQGKTDFGIMFLNEPTRWTTDSKRKAIKDDILISLRAPAGVVNISNIDLSIGRGLASIRVHDNIENFYVFYFLKDNESKISNENDKGGFFSSMNKEYLYDLNIPIPKKLDNYTSCKIQKIIADFIEDIENELQVEFDKMDKAYRALKRLHTAYLARTFTLIDWGEK
jgi:type I restriction enzyme S subunit